MKAYASLWSADLLALGEAVDLVDALVDGYHMDIMDGVCVPDLLFGLDFIAAMRRWTKKTLDVQLMLTNPCGTCVPCLDGRTHLCLNLTGLGSHSDGLLSQR